MLVMPYLRNGKRCQASTSSALRPVTSGFAAFAFEVSHSNSRPDRAVLLVVLELSAVAEDSALAAARVRKRSTVILAEALAAFPLLARSKALTHVALSRCADSGSVVSTIFLRRRMDEVPRPWTKLPAYKPGIQPMVSMLLWALWM